MNNDTTTLNGQTMGTAMADFLKANPNIANQSSPITPAPATAIPATALTPQGSVNVPRPNTATATPVFNEIVQGADNTINEQVARAKAEAEAVQKSVGSEAEKARTSLTDEVKKLFGQKTDVLQGQEQRERDLGIDEQIKARNQVNTEIADTTLRLRAEEDRLRTAGMSKGQLAIEQGNLQDTFGRRLADLAIRQSAVNGNIEAIRSESERKTKLALAPIENSLEFFKTFGMENLNYLTQKDQQKLSMIVTNLENQKKDVKALEDAKANLIMEIANQGGGSNTQLISSIQGAKTQAEALALASKSGYIGREQRLNSALDRQLKQAQLNKIAREANAGNEQIINPSQRLAVQTKVTDLTKLANDKRGLPASVGTTGVGRIGVFERLFGERQNFIAGVTQITDQLTIDNLVKAKQNGATFGALTDGEREMLARSATKINGWAQKDKNGKITGFNASEKDFKNELDRIANFARTDFILRGGDPREVGVQILPDGRLAVPNSTGGITFLE